MQDCMHDPYNVLHNNAANKPEKYDIMTQRTQTLLYNYGELFAKRKCKRNFSYFDVFHNKLHHFFVINHTHLLFNAMKMQFSWKVHTDVEEENVARL